jgi:hypothetical protein
MPMICYVKLGEGNMISLHEAAEKKPEFLHSENWEPTINGEY